MIRLIVLLLCAGLAAAMALPVQAAHRLRVVASFSVLGDMVREVAGDLINLEVLAGPNADPHTWEVTPGAVQALGRAQLLVENGLGFEPWIDRLVASSGFSGSRLVASQGVSLRHLEADTDTAHGHEGHAHSAGSVDPHAWQDLRNGMVYIGNIARALALADPENALAYQARAQASRARMQALDADLRARFAALPPGERLAITAHEAFSYAGAAWGIEFRAAAGLSSDAEPSARAVASLVDSVRAVPHAGIFQEKSTNPRLVSQLAREAGLRMGGLLYSDALDEPDHAAGSYLGMMRWNAETLLRAFE